MRLVLILETNDMIRTTHILWSRIFYENMLGVLLVDKFQIEEDLSVSEYYSVYVYRVWHS